MKPYLPLTLAALTSGFLVSCTADPDPADEIESAASADGSLIKMEMSSQVGVLLDEIPAGAQRDAAAAEALAKPSSFWIERAKRQVRLTYYRLVFRGLYYNSDWSNNGKSYGPLPLPDKAIWNVKLTGKARRATIGTGAEKHDVILIDYSWDSMIVADTVSPGKVDPNLGAVGGVATEAFTFPIDPDLIVERTRNACIDEEEYPPGSYFEENSWYFYDDTCTAGSNWCHLSEPANDSCVNAVRKTIGASAATMKFTRLAYDRATADKYRIGVITNQNGADLEVIVPAMEEERRVVQRYFAPGACELEEGVISKLGWRRLIMFSAVVQNNGTERIHIGKVSDPNNPWVKSNVFEFSQCHGHYHFSHYGNFEYNGAPGSKRAFCLEDTNRFHNDESTSLLAEHQSCDFQGMTPGWGDEYQFGLPGQWVDVTDVDTKQEHDLIFDSNADAFMCEGHPVTDAAGNEIFDPTEFRDSSGNVVSRMRCDRPATWHDDNVGAIPVAATGGSFVNDPCTLGQIGPKRDCGFKTSTALKSCTPGTQVNLTCTSSAKGGAPQVLRICDKSTALGAISCTLLESRANAIVGSTPTQLSFTCPTVLDAAPGTGGYSWESAPLLPSQSSGQISCNW
jgi:hypothetical protein